MHKVNKSSPGWFGNELRNEGVYRQVFTRLRLALLLISIAWVIWHTTDAFGVRGSGVTKVESALKAHLPRGTTRARVKAWLQSNGIVDYSSFRHLVKAIIHDVPNVSYGWSGDIAIEFYFDSNDRLTGYLLEAQEYAL